MPLKAKEAGKEAPLEAHLRSTPLKADALKVGGPGADWSIMVTSQSSRQVRSHLCSSKWADLANMLWHWLRKSRTNHLRWHIFQTKILGREQILGEKDLGCAGIVSHSRQLAYHCSRTT